MKNRFKKFALLLSVLPLSLVFTACGSKSAYELAVENGFEGTEDAWIKSLKGKSAYEIAVENGYQGTEEEWLKSLKGQDGSNGQDGKDAEKVNTYDMYTDAVNKNEFTGTYLEFLKTLSNSSLDKSAEIASKAAASVVCLKNSSSSGSAVIYKYNDDGSAYLVTNFHMVPSVGAQTSCKINIYVNLSASTTTDQNDIYQNSVETFDAIFVGGSLSNDIAVLKIEDSSKLKAAHMRQITTDSHKLGDTCFAVGNNSSNGIAVTKGTISNESEVVTTKISTINVPLRVFRHDAYITNGNSGGGLFDSEGNFIGITNGGIGKDTELRNYAIPANIVTAVADNIIENTENEKLSGLKFDLGINLTTSSTIIEFDEISSSIVVNEVVKINNTSKNLDWNLVSGDPTIFTQVLVHGDTVLEIDINGKTYPITRAFNLKEYLLTARIGGTIKLKLKRGNDEYQISLFLSSDLSSELN